MGRIVASYLFPHPPVVVPGVGQGREREASPTLDAMRAAAAALAEAAPDVLLLITPHAPAFGDYFRVASPPVLSGDLSSFGDRSPALRFQGSAAMADLLAEEAGRDALPAGPALGTGQAASAAVEALDHGAVVPLHFITEAFAGRPLPTLVHLSISGLDLLSHYRYGQAAARAVLRMPDVDGRTSRVAVVASGDMSHCLKKSGPYGFNPEGPRFDALVEESFRAADPSPLFHLTARQREDAGECGLRSVLFLFGVNDGRRLKGEVLSHEGPFGVGYLVARLLAGEEVPSALPGIEAALDAADGRRRQAEGPLVSLARRTLELRLRGKADEPADRNGFEEQLGLLRHPAGAFVSLHSPDGSLRGCIGTVFPQRPDLAREIAANAESAAFHDPRFPPLEEHELDGLDISVDVMGTPEPVRSKDELDSKRYGVIVRKGFRSGLLLPDLEGVDSVAEQLSIALRKGGISADEDYSIERFEARRFT